METIIAQSPPTSVSLSIDTQLYLGKGQIRRNTAQRTILYTGTSTTDRLITVPALNNMTINETLPLGALYVATDTPITVTLDGTLILPIQKLLFLDLQTVRTIRFDNTGNTDAKVHLAYML